MNPPSAGAFRFAQDPTPDQRELVRLRHHAAFALGVPFEGEISYRGGDVKSKLFAPLQVREDWGFEESVWQQLRHIYEQTPEAPCIVQAEVGSAEWREENRLAYVAALSLPNWHRVSFGERTGYYVGKTVHGIPVVVVPDVDKVVLRPRWPETERLVQGA